MSNKGNKKLHLHMHKTYHKEKTKKLYKHSKLNLSIIILYLQIRNSIEFTINLYVKLNKKIASAIKYI